MESIFFGPSATPLYGVYCPARPDRARAEGIVFCYPFGQEYIRAHRCIRLLALSLADMGYHVLRFDYRGTGDSSGDMDGVEIANWQQDIQLAVTELSDMAALDKFALIGLRLGGLVATMAAVNSGNVSRLVLWDPVTNGDMHLQELRENLQRQAESSGIANFIDSEQTIHLHGFAMPLLFQNSLSELELSRFDISQIGSVLQLVSHEIPPFIELRDRWSGFAHYDYQLATAPHDWNYDDNFGSILLPHPIMAAIKDWFA